MAGTWVHIFPFLIFCNKTAFEKLLLPSINERHHTTFDKDLKYWIDFFFDMRRCYSFSLRTKTVCFWQGVFAHFVSFRLQFKLRSLCELSLLSRSCASGRNLDLPVRRKSRFSRIPQMPQFTFWQGMFAHFLSKLRNLSNYFIQLTMLSRQES